MRKGKVRGALVGVESVTEEGLKAVYKDFNESGDALIAKLRKFREHGVYILGSFIFGLPQDREDTFDATVELAQKADTMFAPSPLTPHPGTVDFQRWEKEQDKSPTLIDGIPLTRYWLLPHSRRPKLCMPHPTMTAEEVRVNTLGAWTQFYSFSRIWSRAKVCTVRLRSRLMFLMISKLFCRCTRRRAWRPTAHARAARTAGRAGGPNGRCRCSRSRRDRFWSVMEPATNEAGM
ncbi:MAG: hypothetical protein R2724_03710 [Bryobacterales bacterium]